MTARQGSKTTNIRSNRCSPVEWSRPASRTLAGRRVHQCFSPSNGRNAATCCRRALASFLPGTRARARLAGVASATRIPVTEHPEFPRLRTLLLADCATLFAGQNAWTDPSIAVRRIGQQARRSQVKSASSGNERTSRHARQDQGVKSFSGRPRWQADLPAPCLALARAFEQFGKVPRPRRVASSRQA